MGLLQEGQGVEEASVAFYFHVLGAIWKGDGQEDLKLTWM